MNKKTLTRYGRLVKKIGKEFDKENEDDEDIYFSSGNIRNIYHLEESI